MCKPIHDIPGNKLVQEELRTLIRSGNAVAFVGAGASAGLYPMWGQLIQRLADSAVASGLFSAADRDFCLRIASRRPQQAAREIAYALRRDYPALINAIFAPISPGPPSTPTQRALAQLKFRGYVTTNYDRGLLEACRAARTGHTVDHGTWKEPTFVQGWRDGSLLQNPLTCPILFAHGIHTRPDTIVLTSKEYWRAYDSNGQYPGLFSDLWSNRSLVFTGFGFSDPWMDFMINNVLMRLAPAAVPTRHIAIIGLPEDEAYTSGMRGMFQDDYNAKILFYPVKLTADGQEDHSELGRILDWLLSDPQCCVPGGEVANLRQALLRPPAERPLALKQANAQGVRWVLSWAGRGDNSSGRRHAGRREGSDGVVFHVRLDGTQCGQG